MSQYNSQLTEISALSHGQIISYREGRDTKLAVISDVECDAQGAVSGFNTYEIYESAASGKRINRAEAIDMGLTGNKRYSVAKEQRFVQSDKETLGTKSAKSDVANVVGEMNPRQYHRFVDQAIKSALSAPADISKSFSSVGQSTTGAGNERDDKYKAIAIYGRPQAKKNELYRPETQETTATTGFDISLSDAVSLDLISQEVKEQICAARRQSPETLKQAKELLAKGKSKAVQQLSENGVTTILNAAWGKLLGDALQIESDSQIAQKYQGKILRPTI